MTGEMILTNAMVVMRHRMLRGTVAVRDGLIAAVDETRSVSPAAVDLEGDYLIPGMVELHTDNLERHVAPRPGVRWPGLHATIAHDGQIATAGITTVFDAISVGDVRDGGDRMANLEEMADSVTMAQNRGLLRAEHFLHMRCEVNYGGVVNLIHSFLNNPLVRLVSVMDHTPGQRQFVNPAKYREYYMGRYSFTDEQMDRFMARQCEDHARFSAANRAAVVRLCRQKGLPLASHDDATADHVEEAAADGMVIAEFPTTEEAARMSHERGLKVLMGAPNMVRGQSHSGNISARELADGGLLDILSSDYIPASLLPAAFVLARQGEGIVLPDAIAAVSAVPAEAAGLADRGEIAVGRRADLVRVREVEGMPCVAAVWCHGRRVA